MSDKIEDKGTGAPEAEAADDGKDEFSGYAMGSDEPEDEAEEAEEADDPEAEKPDAPRSDPDRVVDKPPASAPVTSKYSEADYLKGVDTLDGEMDSLAERYEMGEIEFGEYRKKERELLEQRDTLRQAAFNLQAERQRREQDWRGAVDGFLKEPENAVFATGGPLAPLMRERLESKLQQDANRAYRDLLDESAEEIRRGMMQFLGIDAEPRRSGRGTPAAPAVDELKKRRDARLASATNTPAKAGRSAQSPDPFEGWAAI